MILDSDRGPIAWEMSLPTPATGAAAFCKHHHIELQPEGRALLRPGLATEDYFAALWEQGNYADARRILAHALPKRRALWWGCLCAWDLYRPCAPEELDAVLHAVVAFVLEPTEARRRAAFASARDVDPQSLAACLANAAFFSGGSVSPAGLPDVEPQPFVTGRLVGVVVYLASVLQAPLSQYKERLHQYLALGVEVARGHNLWPDSTPTVSGKLREWAAPTTSLPAAETAGASV